MDKNVARVGGFRILVYYIVSSEMEGILKADEAWALPSQAGLGDGSPGSPSDSPPAAC